MRIIGIDPGSRFTGYGIVDRGTDRLIHVDCGVIAPPTDAPIERRLGFIHDRLAELLAIHRPDSAAVEDVFYAKNWRSALALGQARGAALTALAGAGIAVSAYPPATVKQQVVGGGRAQKQQVQHMVRILLGLPEVPEENAADALAVAICHFIQLNKPQKSKEYKNWADFVKKNPNKVK